MIGLIIYAAFTILTGFYLGYIALAVGFIVAKAVMLGSKGIGGKRYQITAVLLTYAAVSMAAIPIWFHAYTQEKGTSGPQAKQVASSNPDSGSLPKSQEQDDSKPSFGKAIRAFGFLALIGLASPFLELQDPFHGIIGLVILLVGIRIAWKMTAGKNQLEIYGPFEASKSASV